MVQVTVWVCALTKMITNPEKKELRTLLEAYSATPARVTREEFLLYAKDWVPDEEKLKSLLKSFDEGRVTMEEFIMWGIPPVAPPAVKPKIDLLAEFDRFEATKKDLLALSSIRSYRSVIKPFLAWLTDKGIPATDVTEPILMEYIHDREEEKGEKYAVGAVMSIFRHIKSFFAWLYDVRVLDSNPLDRLKIKGVKGSPDIFNIVVEERELISSEVNPIYNTLYTHPDRFADWRRFEIEIRILRETGLRPIHALKLEFQDIDLERKVIWYDRIRKYERVRKHMPFRETRTSDILVKRINTYLEMHPEITPGDKVFTEYDPHGFYQKFMRLRVVGGIPRIYPYMFRYSFCTLIVCVLPKEEMWTEYTGDTPSTLRKHYARRLSVEYDEGGLHSYDDIIRIVFNNEGILEGEIPSKRPVGRPRKRQAFILPEYE